MSKRIPVGPAAGLATVLEVMIVGATDLQAEAAAQLKAWDCPAETLTRMASLERRLREGSDAEASPAVHTLFTLLHSDDLTYPWLTRFNLDDTLAALALILVAADRAAQGSRTAAAPSAAPLPGSLLSRCEHFGVWEAKRALSDLDFRLRDVDRYGEVQRWFEQFQQDHREHLANLLKIVEERTRNVANLLEARFDYCAVKGASRRLSSLKTRGGNVTARPQHFGQLKIVVPTVADCYRALEAVHLIGQPEPGQFRDLIAAPRGNGYSGLFTSIWIETENVARTQSWREVQPVFEVAIQTRLMDELSSLGIAHPAFRERVRRPRSEPPTAEERGLARLVDSLTDDRLHTITVFTTRGEARTVPSGATALDLAYRIHTELGNRAVAAEVNGRRASLGAPLPPGASVTIITDPAGEGRVEADLGLVAEARTRRQIVHFLNREPARKGRHALVNYLDTRGAALEPVELDALATEVAERRGYRDARALYQAIARAESRRHHPASGASAALVTVGEVGVEMLKRRYERLPNVAAPVSSDANFEWIPFLEDERYSDRSLRFRLCAHCRPSQRVGIVGTERRGIVTVHVSECRWTAGRPLLALRWQKVERTVRAKLAVLAWDRPRLIADVLEPAYELYCGIDEVSAAVTEGGRASLHLKLHLRSAIALVKLLQMLPHVSSVLRVTVEEASLPASLLERVRTGPWGEDLLSELTARGYGELSRRHVLMAPNFVPRRVTIRLPYTLNKPTYSPRSFVGRQADVRWLAEHTVEAETGGAALVLGPARIGKTSLCLRFLDQLPEPRPESRRIDLRNLWHQTTEQALGSLTAHLSPLAGVALTDRPPTAATVVDLVQRAVERLGGRHLVLVLDEFGGPVRAFEDGILDAEFFDVIPLLMDLRLPLSLVLVALPQAHLALHRTGLWAQLRACRDRQLGAMEPAETQEMIVRPFAEQGVQWDDAAIELLAYQAGRLPLFIIFLLQEITHQLNVNAQKHYVRTEDVRLASSKLLRSSSLFGYWLERWRDSPVKQTCLRAIMARGRRGVIDEEAWRREVLHDRRWSAAEFDGAVSSLVTEGVMTRDARTYSFVVPMFWSWLDLNLRSAAHARSLGLDT